MFKEKAKLAGMIATMGTMTLSSCTPNENSEDNDKKQIEIITKPKAEYNDVERKVLYERKFDKTAHYDTIKLNKPIYKLLYEHDSLYRSLFYHTMDGEFKELDHMLKNGGHKYINVADSVEKFTLLDLALVVLNDIQGWAKANNKEKQYLGDITNFDKTVKILIKFGADPTLVSSETLDDTRRVSPETYELLMKTIQNNTIMKNKTIEKSR